jgi:general secretion pathway protein D
MPKYIDHNNRAAKALRPLLGVCLFFLLGILPGFAAQTVTLNFKDADIESVIGWMAEQTGKNFIVDPRVKSKVTIISGKPLNKDELYQVFLSVLQVHGFAAVPSGDVIKIVPDINAKQDGVPVADDKNPGQGDEVITRVIPLENVPAAQLVPILRPLIPQQGHMVAYPPSNVLIISDRATNIDRIAEIISRVDLPSAENEVEVIPLQHASAAEVARILTALEQQNQQNAQKQGGQLEGRPTFIADERTNSILLGGSKTNRLQIRALISDLDTPLEREGDIHVIYLRYANAKDLAPVLTGIGQKVAQEEQAKKGRTAAAGGQTKAQNFDIQADESTNALVITASLEVFRSLQAVIRQLDVRRAQVLVDAIIAEISLNKAAQLGIQWAVDGTPSGHGPIGFTNFASGTSSSLSAIAGAALSGAAGAASALSAAPQGLTLGIGRFNSNTINFGALLSALQGDGSTNVLSTPTLLTLDNQEAEIVVGQNVPFVTGSYSTAGTSGTSTLSSPFQTIERQNVGIDLKVKPQINEGNTIKLDVEQKVDSLAASSAGAADLITNTRSIKTTVLVDDGAVVVLGGLIKDDLTESVQKVPGLGDLPLIGGLFRYKSTTKDKTDLMVFLHPVIMRDESLLADVSGDKYNYIRAKELETREKGVSLLHNEESPLMRPLDELLELPPPFSANPPPAAKP